MLVIYDTAWTIFKIVSVRLMNNGVSTEIRETFSIHYSLWGKFLKRNLIYLYFSKYNEINIGHSNFQKHAFYKNDINC